MQEKKLRTATKQPGVYHNGKTGKYDVKYSYTEYDPVSNKKKYRAKWVYGINSYKTAVSILAEMKSEKVNPGAVDITLEQALDLWMNKARANNYSQVSIRNTKQQYNMILKF